MKRTAQLYLIIVSIVGLGIFLILHAGSQLPPPVSERSTQSVAVTAPHLTDVSGSSFFASVESVLRQNATIPVIGFDCVGLAAAISSAGAFSLIASLLG